MARSGLLGLGAGALLVAGVGLLTALDPAAGWPEFVFGSVVCLAALTGVLLAGRARSRVRSERDRDRRLAGTQVEEVAARAVSVERARLAADIESVVRTAAVEMGRSARTAEREWARDPEPALQAVQEQGRRAGLELRRLLGLLRDAGSPQSAPAPGPDVALRLSWSDVVVGTAVTALAVTETFLWAAVEGVEGVRPFSVLITACAAATVALRRPFPGPGAALCGLLFAAGIWTAPVVSGLWVLATLGGLTWTALARRTLFGTVGTAVLVLGVLVGTAVRDPENLEINALLLAVAATGGLVVGWSDARREAARSRADRRAAELDAVARQTAQRERLAVARELHDLVSHAVGVMVVQAGAALALRGVDPLRARRAVAVVRRTAAECLSELDRLVAVIGAGALGVPGARPPSPPWNEVAEMVGRMRLAGLAVRCEAAGSLQGEAAAAVYRIVQESLTNVLRHAPGADVLVHVDATSTLVEVEVVDDGPGPEVGARRGYGLVGLAERVDALGGELSAGPGAGGAGFRVRAVLPTAGGGP